MRKLFISLSASVLTSVSAVGVSGCAWTTPPLNVQQIDQIMMDLQKQSLIGGTIDPNIIMINNGAPVAAFPPVTAKKSDINQKNDTANADAGTWTTVMTTAVSTEILKLVQSKKQLDGTKTDNYSNLNLQGFETNNFTVDFANIYCSSGVSTINSQSPNIETWVYSAPDSSFTNFNDWNKKPVQNKGQQTTKGNQGSNYSYLTPWEIWTAGKLFDQNANSIMNPYYSSSSKGYIYTVRFMVKFSPGLQYKIDPVVFYIEANFSV